MSKIIVAYKLPNGKYETREFASPVSLAHVGTIGDELGSHIFDAYEDGVLLGGWAVFKGGWSYCGR